MKTACLTAAALAIPALLALPVAAEAADGKRFAATVGLHSAVGGDRSVNAPLDDYPRGSAIEREGGKWGEAMGLSGYLTPNIAVELWRGNNARFSDHIDVENGTDVPLAGYRLRPWALTAQYHFNADGRIRPFVGAGLQHTRANSVWSNPEIPGLEGGWAVKGGNGVTGLAGMDVNLNERWFVRGDMRYMKTRGTVHYDNMRGRTSLNVLNYGVSAGLRF